MQTRPIRSVSFSSRFLSAPFNGHSSKSIKNYASKRSCRGKRDLAKHFFENIRDVIFALDSHRNETKIRTIYLLLPRPCIISRWNGAFIRLASSCQMEAADWKENLRERGGGFEPSATASTLSSLKPRPWPSSGKKGRVTWLA